MFLTPKQTGYIVMKKAIFILLIGFFFVQTLSAQISADVTEGCAPLVGVQFNSPANATNISWIFGDGASAEIASPTHTYINEGIYIVEYTATINGNPTSEELTISVYGKPNPFFELTPVTACVGEDINFTDLSVGGGFVDVVGWEWLFGDGQLDDEQNPTHAYGAAGTYDVTLQVTDVNGCDSLITIVDAVDISNTPLAVINSDPFTAIACVPPLTVSFFGNNSDEAGAANVSYTWDFDNGETSSEIDPPAVTFTEMGIYNVTLTVSAEPNGCSHTATKQVVVSNPLVDFQVVNAVNDTTCQEVIFNNLSSPGGYIWDFGDGMTSTSADPTHVYEATGTYDVTLTVSAGGCQSDTTMTIEVINVAADFSSNPTYSCSLPYEIQFTDLSTSAASWQWQFGNGDTSTEQNPTLVIEDSNEDPFFDYTIHDLRLITSSLIVTSVYGCTDTILGTDSLFLPTARFIPTIAQGCVPLEVIFQDKSTSNEPIVNWYYDFDDGNTANITTDGTISHTFTEAGDYDVFLVITNELGCFDTSYVQTIQVGNLPTPEFELDTTQICPNQPVQITDITPLSDSLDTWHFEADGGLLTNCIDDSIVTWSFIGQTGPQDITLIAGHNGCYDTTIVADAITVLGPMGRIEYTCDCSEPYHFDFQGDFQLADSWDWIFGDGDTLFNSTDIAPSHDYIASGDYWVKLISYREDSVCAPFVDSVLLNVRNLTADFEADTIACVGIPHAFDASMAQDVHENCYKGYQWYFDDGKHPIWTDTSIYQYAFGGSGDHEVRLITEDINGCRDTNFLVVRAFRVDALFEASPITGCINPDPFTTNFSDLSTADTTIASWAWDFGDGIGMSEEQNPSYTYGIEPADSLFSTILTVTDVLGCPGNYAINIIPSLPHAGFIATSPNTICIGETVSFAPDSLNHVDYNWDFANGSPDNDQYPTATFTEAGTYDITLSVTDTLGCERTFTLEDYVTVQPIPIADFLASSDTLETVCWGELITFTNNSNLSSNYTLSWDLGNGDPVVPNESVGTIYGAPGTYEVSMIITSSIGCSDMITKTIEVEGPLADFELDPEVICPGQDITFTITNQVDVVTYAWDFGDGDTAGAVPTITHTYNIDPSSGATFASLVYWSEDSVCTGKTTKPINFHNVIANFNRNGELILSDTMHCAGIADVFTNTSLNADDAEWDFGDGTTFSGNNPPPHTYPTPGEYTVTLSIVDEETGCTDEISKLMIITDKPGIDLFSDGACEGDSVQLVATGGVTYEWSPSTGLDNPNIPNPIAAIDSTTTYSVTVTDAVGCSDTDSIQAIIYYPIEDFEVDTSLVIGDSLQLDAYGGPGLLYNWSPPTGLSCTDCPSPFIAPLQGPVTYNVNIFDPAGCYTSDGIFRVDVRRVTSIDVPTAFTPNGDGINDVIFVDGWGIQELVEFKIYNRYGQLVFESNDLTLGWDGFFEGQLQNAETYVYTARAISLVNNQELYKQGAFNLLR